MKAFLLLVLLGILGVCFYFIFMSMAPDESQSMALMFGNSTENEVEMHVELTNITAGEDTYGYYDAEGNMDWAAWAKAHYIVKDAAGNQVEFARNVNSNLQPKKDAARGYHDSFLICKLAKGVDYTFTYIPVVGEPGQYLYTFTSPMGDAERLRVRFEPI